MTEKTTFAISTEEYSATGSAKSNTDSPYLSAELELALAQTLQGSFEMERRLQQALHVSTRALLDAVEELSPIEVRSLGALVADEEEVDIPLAVLGSISLRQQAKAATALGEAKEANDFMHASQYLYAVTNKDFVQPDSTKPILKHSRVGETLQGTITALFAYNAAQEAHNSSPFTIVLENLDPSELQEVTSLADDQSSDIKDAFIMAAIIVANRQSLQARRLGLSEESLRYASAAETLKQIHREFVRSQY